MSTIKIRTLRQDNDTEIRLLITHPMENGRNRDAGGTLIPAHFIESLVIKLNEATVINVDMSGSIAKNPFFTFRLKTLSSGDKISATWVDNRHFSDSVDHLID